jgi:hypothetical protein
MIDRIGLGADHQSSPALVLRLVLQIVTQPAITNFLPGTGRLRRKGPFPGRDYPAGSAGSELQSR